MVTVMVMDGINPEKKCQAGMEDSIARLPPMLSAFPPVYGGGTRGTPGGLGRLAWRS